MADKLVSWLRLQIDYDEQLIQAATPGPWQTYVAHSGIRSSQPYAFVMQPNNHGAIVERHTHGTVADINYIAHYDPVYALRVLSALRTIIDTYVVAAEFYNRPGNRHIPAGEAQGLRTALIDLVEIYSDREGYEEVMSS